MPPTVPDWPRPEANSVELGVLAETLAEMDGAADDSGEWPESLWSALVESGATRWALPGRFGGDEPTREELVRRYAKVAEGSLTAAFILTQHDAAIRRLEVAAESGRGTADAWLAKIADGTAFPTVGISQLTTSRRMGDRAMAAKSVDDGFQLDGAMPWVTAAERADLFVTGGVLDDGRQFLAAIPGDSKGLIVREAFDLAALGASRTAEIACDAVFVPDSSILAGPSENVMAIPGLAGTGGLETSALALGQARAALVAIATLAADRADLVEPLEALSATWSRVAQDLLNAANGVSGSPAPASIRGDANDLALRSTQAFLTARKGSGFLKSEPAQRWARQALFFLVWSCPSPVANAAIRDLAGLCEL